LSTDTKAFESAALSNVTFKRSESERIPLSNPLSLNQEPFLLDFAIREASALLTD